jgi:peptidoglycan-associated lipoprotein
MKIRALSAFALLSLFAGGCAKRVCEKPTTVIDSGPCAGSTDEFIALGDRVYFGFDKQEISPEAQQTLCRQAEWLKRNCAIKVFISGHCDARGTTSYNYALGARRANAVKQALLKLGIESSRISVISYGKDKPVVDGCDEEAFAKNRVAITVLDKPCPAPEAAPTA